MKMYEVRRRGKENIEEQHEFTKNMLNIIRRGFKNIIKEETEKDESITPTIGDSIFNDELKKLQNTVNPRVKVTNFKIYPTDQNVIIEGVFLQREDPNSGIKFKMSLAAGEIETSMSDIELDDKVSILLQKLKGYYENWVDEWALKLSSEYKPKTND